MSSAGYFSRSGSAKVSVGLSAKLNCSAARAARRGKSSAKPMGRCMSGVPSCALIAPSSNSTIECTTDCGWISTEIRSAGIPKSQRASITSNPLLTSVAESIVILAPMRHCGCRRACSTVTSASRSRGTSRSAPPEQVTISRRAGDASPTRHWKMAECSESIGRIGTRRSAASRMT